MANRPYLTPEQVNEFHIAGIQRLIGFLSRVGILPNQSLEPMARSVTSRAGARAAPALTMAHH